MQRTTRGREKIRGRIREVVSDLHRLDDELCSLAESLVLPLDADEMWALRLPMSFPAHLYAALDAVRSDCLHEAITILLRAVRQSDVSLRRQFLREVAKSVGTSEVDGVSDHG